ncbi:MAG: hypothetical protein ACK56I_33160, partial [bacterium]
NAFLITGLQYGPACRGRRRLDAPGGLISLPAAGGPTLGGLVSIGPVIIAEAGGVLRQGSRGRSGGGGGACSAGSVLSRTAVSAASLGLRAASTAAAAKTALAAAGAALHRIHRRVRRVHRRHCSVL